MSNTVEDNNKQKCPFSNVACYDCIVCGFYDGSDDHESRGGSIGNRYHAFREYLKTKRFEKIAYGSFRATYGRGKIVIKVPLNKDGEVDNMTEHRAWHQYKSKPDPSGIMMAPCRLLSNGCLMMVRIDRSYYNPRDIYHSWIKSIDAMQVGMYRGKVVAFDFAVDILERAEWEKEWGTKSYYFHNNKGAKPVQRYDYDYTF